jgi:hypothetical protein
MNEFLIRKSGKDGAARSIEHADKNNMQLYIPVF